MEMTCRDISTFNMVSGSLNKMLTVSQCTEILLYCKKLGVLQTDSKVTVLTIPSSCCCSSLSSSSSSQHFQLICNLHYSNTKCVQCLQYETSAYSCTSNIKCRIVTLSCPCREDVGDQKYCLTHSL